MAVQDDAETLRAVLDSLQTGVCQVDRNGKIILWNSGAERITGYLRQDVLGRSTHEDFLQRVDSKSQELFGDDAPLAAVLRDGKSNNAWVSLRHRMGHRVPVFLHVSAVRDAHGTVVGATESFNETIAVLDWEQRRSKLGAYGCLDEASGALNHGMVQAHLREMLVTFSEHPVPFSILRLAIDDFDGMRARQGSGSVSQLLRMVAQTLENTLRPTDFLGRWEENGFLAILTECDEEEISRAGERLRRMVSQAKTVWWGDALQVTVSMGGATAEQGDSIETILQRAENGLSGSKKQGGNCLTVCAKQGVESTED